MINCCPRIHRFVQYSKRQERTDIHITVTPASMPEAIASNCCTTMSQHPASLPLSTLGPSSESSHADVVGHLARAAQTVTLIGELTPLPAGPILRAIGGSATIIVSMVQQHLKNKKDAKNLISDIEKSVSIVCAEAKFLSPLTSPRFHEAMNEFKLSLDRVRGSLEISQSPPQRTWDKLKRRFRSDSVRETLLEHAEEFRRLRENLQLSCLMEVQCRVDALHESKFLADCLQPISHEVRNAARAEPCMEGTRIDVLDKISAWVKDPDAKNIFWINGGPGAGKSAVAASVVKMLQDAHQLGSFYVFRHGHAKLADPIAVWCTIVHDLVQTPPPSSYGQFHGDFRRKILTLLRDGGFDAGHKAVMAQFRALIQGPLSQLGLSGCPVVVIDALDECGSGPGQLVQMLGTLELLPRHFKVIVTGRNVHDVERVLSPISEVFTLTSGVDVSSADLADIGGFFKAQLPWVVPRVHEKLQEKAAGLFIWAKTAVTFLNESLDKNGCLAQILASSSSIVGDINDLYSAVLSESFGKCTQAELDLIKQVLSVLILSQVPLDKQSILQFT
ncbi:hypothetical protein BD779DRAFT_1646789, partial [Infundibulicybe gibba]